jgi:ABC-type transport system involved in cytochrome bd biosynthesis fused ATPase/permease subunit
VLAGFNRPERGLLLSCGLDPQSLGRTGWNERVTLVPQFNDNHVLGGTFAYNVLLGRRWPAQGDDLAQAEAVCRELGLGPLLERMPAGMRQMVGETGWQLSHGERSRLFAARALTSGAELVILDESAAALDPESTELVLDCARRRARALLVIQHP